MGNCSSFSSNVMLMRRSSYRIIVTTGDKKYAGTDANVFIRLHDDKDASSPSLELDVIWRNDFERGATDDFSISSDEWQLGRLSWIEIWRDNAGVGEEWYVEKVEVLDNHAKDSYVFPCHRWIGTQPVAIQQFDAHLPQDEKHPKQREQELSLKRKQYELTIHKDIPGYPVQVKTLPLDEAFSEDYRDNLVGLKRRLIGKLLLVKLISLANPFKSFENMEKLYQKLSPKERPLGLQRWRSDVWFGCQRVQGTNPVLIRLCQEIPSNFGVTEEMILPLLDGMTLPDALSQKKLFICDLKVLETVKFKDQDGERPLCHPLALFFLNSSNDLLPIAIQLFQTKGPENPVFLPSDDKNLWLLAKMWYNSAEAAHHQTLAHLCFTHLKAEAICLSIHRNLSPSHPIFKLLAPHFLFLLAVNNRSLSFLTPPGGPFDKLISFGVDGMEKLSGQEADNWLLNVDGHMLNSAKARGVDDPAVLPHYPYRDDAVLVWAAIEKYIRRIVEIYYDSPDALVKDYELQRFARELVLPLAEGGVGLKGVPGNGKLDNFADFIELLTCTVSMCSMGHGASNFCQYDEYGFTPNYPSRMRGKPPTTKDAKEEIDLLQALPDKDTTLLAIMVSRLLSQKDSNSIGEYEVTYMYDPRAQAAFKEFRQELSEASKTIKERNKARQYPYMVLDPDYIPNSIAI